MVSNPWSASAVTHLGSWFISQVAWPIYSSTTEIEAGPAGQRESRPLLLWFVNTGRPFYEQLTLSSAPCYPVALVLCGRAGGRVFWAFDGGRCFLVGLTIVEDRFLDVEDKASIESFFVPDNLIDHRELANFMGVVACEVQIGLELDAGTYEVAIAEAVGVSIDAHAECRRALRLSEHCLMGIDMGIASLDREALSYIFLGRRDCIALGALDEIGNFAEGDLIEALVGLEADGVDDAHLGNSGFDGFAKRVGGVLPSVVDRGVYPSLDLLPEKKLMIVGMREAFAASKEIGHIQVAQIGVSHGCFVEEELIGPFDQQALTRDVAVIVVGCNFAGRAAVDVEAAILHLHAVDWLDIEVEAAHVESPSPRCALLCNARGRQVCVHGNLLDRVGLGVAQLEGLSVAATHEVRIGPVEVLPGGGMEDYSVAALPVELELAVDDAPLLALVIFMSVVGV